MDKTKNDLNQKSKKKKKLIRLGIIIGVIVVIIFLIVNSFRKQVANLQSSMSQDATVTIKDLEYFLSSSGIVEPLDSYTVTTLSSVEGTVLEADFEEGDSVEEGDVLYTISTDDLDSRIDTAKKTVTKSERSYSRAKEDLATAQKDLSDFTVESDLTGYIKDLKVKVGDSIQPGTVIADIYDNTKMELYVPFNASSVTKSLIGKSATIELSESEEKLKGKVTEVSSIDEALSGNRVVRYVTIEITNPGGIAVDTKANATIGSLDSNEEGSFRIKEEGSIVSDISGKISKISYKKGDWIKDGNVIVQIEADTYDSQLKTYEDQVQNAKDNLESAEDELDKVIDSKTDYIVTSPITGTIIKKNVKAGDTINMNNMAGGLCVIYDLSAMTFEMLVDELDIMDVEVGQTVIITADAIEEKEFQGTITKISLESTTNGGVTQYPVTVRIKDTGELLPGMNITGEVLVASATNALTIPADALMRGNRVFIKDETVTEAVEDVPVGYKSVDVKIGLNDGEFLEVVSGLSEGMEIYMPARQSSNVFDNMQMSGPMGGGGSSNDVVVTSPGGGY